MRESRIALFAQPRVGSSTMSIDAEDRAYVIDAETVYLFMDSPRHSNARLERLLSNFS